MDNWPLMLRTAWIQMVYNPYHGIFAIVYLQNWVQYLWISLGNISMELPWVSMGKKSCQGTCLTVGQGGCGET